jgi:hypothetical protein
MEVVLGCIGVGAAVSAADSIVSLLTGGIAVVVMVGISIVGEEVGTIIIGRWVLNRAKSNCCWMASMERCWRG